MLEVRTEDVLWYADHSLDEMVAILRQLGDETANRRPRLPGANSPFAIVTHCLGVMEFWAGAVIADRPIVRDRDAEFSRDGGRRGARRRGPRRRGASSPSTSNPSPRSPRRAARGPPGTRTSPSPGPREGWSSTSSRS